MILVGFIVQIFIGNVIKLHNFNDICDKNGIRWLLLIAVSCGVAFVTAIKRRYNKVRHGLFAFIGSFLLNLSGYQLGYPAIVCSGSQVSYSYLMIPIVAPASLIIGVHFLKKETEQEKINDFPDPELILLGVCIQQAVYGFFILMSSPFFCTNHGIVSWVELVIASGVLVILNSKKYGASRRSLFTFVGSFIVHLSISGIGWAAMVCTADSTLENEEMAKTYLYVTMGFHALLAPALIIIFMNKDRDPPRNPNVVTPNSPTRPTQRPYPLQAPLPPQAPNPSRALNPLQAPYPPQASYPPQVSYPPQALYPLGESNLFAQLPKDDPPAYSTIQT